MTDGAAEDADNSMRWRQKDDMEMIHEAIKRTHGAQSTTKEEMKKVSVTGN